MIMPSRHPVIAALIAILALAGAEAFVAVLPPSDCSTRLMPHPLVAIPFFIVYLVAGSRAILRGSEEARMLLFGATAVLMVIYVIGLAATVPDLMNNSCANSRVA